MSMPRSPAENEFIDQFGLVAETGGLTRITGRIWSLLILSEDAMAPAEIAESLQVSRASVSMSLKLLVQFELLDIKTKVGDRQTYYAIREQPYRSMIHGHAKRVSADLAVVRGALLHIEKPLVRSRLHDLETLYEVSLKGYAGMLATLEALRR